VIVVVVVVLVLIAAGVLGMAAHRGSSWRQDQAGARQEALAGDVTASWPVQIRTEGLFAFRGPGMRGGLVSLRGGFIVVVHAAPAARLLNQGEFYFAAREARLWVESGAFGRREWLVISGPSSGQCALVSVSPGSHAVLGQMWHALLAAGATMATEMN
jgi:hypothetical protein